MTQGNPVMRRLVIASEKVTPGQQPGSGNDRIEPLALWCLHSAYWTESEEQSHVQCNNSNLCNFFVIEAWPDLTGYLLNPIHPDNGGKAPFFLSLGFTPENWRALAAALRKVGQGFPVAKRVESAHGVKYVLDGHIESPGGTTPGIRTIWIIDDGLEVPRLVTAYPHKI